MKKLIVLSLSALLFACGGEEKKEDSKEKKETKSKKISGFSGAEYSFSDSSVEPRYARSWSVSVNGSKVTFIIRSYEDILIEEKFDLNQEQANLINDVVTNLEGIDDLKHNGESGSTAEGLTIYSGKEVVAEAYWNEGMNPSITEYGNAMKSLVPNFDELMESTRINGPIVFLSDNLPEDLNLEEFNAVAEKYDFRVVPDSESEADFRKKTNELRNKLMILVRGEDWRQKFESETGNSLADLNI